MSTDFGLRDALGEEEHVKLVRRQLAIALMYGEMEAVVRLRDWLVANGHDDDTTEEKR